MAIKLTSLPEDDFLIVVLHLADAALIASLVVIVALARFDSLVARLKRKDESEEDLHWVSRTDHSNLKIKVATAIVAISSIHLLQVILKVGTYEEPHILWRVVIHMVFVVGAVLLGLQGWIGRQARESSRRAAQAAGATSARSGTRIWILIRGRWKAGTMAATRTKSPAGSTPWASSTAASSRGNQPSGRPPDARISKAQPRDGRGALRSRSGVPMRRPARSSSAARSPTPAMKLSSASGPEPWEGDSMAAGRSRSDIRAGRMEADQILYGLSDEAVVLAHETPSPVPLWPL